MNLSEHKDMLHSLCPQLHLKHYKGDWGTIWMQPSVFFQSVSIISMLLSVMSPYTQNSSRNRVSAVLRIPSCLLPSDSSSLAWPQSSACTHSINGIVRKQRGLYILTWMDAWGSFHFGWQGYSVFACLFPGFTRVLCKQQLCSTDTGHGGE